jgi:hypothetical protein
MPTIGKSEGPKNQGLAMHRQNSEGHFPAVGQRQAARTLLLHRQPFLEGDPDEREMDLPKSPQHAHEAGCQMPDARRQMSYARCQMPDARRGSSLEMGEAHRHGRHGVPLFSKPGDIYCGVAPIHGR